MTAILDGDSPGPCEVSKRAVDSHDFSGDKPCASMSATIAAKLLNAFQPNRKTNKLVLSNTVFKVTGNDYFMSSFFAK